VPGEIARLTDRLLSEVAAREPLPPEEEARLARLVADGKDARARLAAPGIQPGERQRLEEAARLGREALAALIEHNLPFVVRMAGRYRWSGVPVIDLFQEGVLGLLRAAERFDWTRGTPFGAYASWWVRHAMSRAARDATLSVRLPGHLHSSLGRLAAERRADPSASWDVLAERAGVEAAEAENLAPLLGPPLSLDASLGPDSDVSLGDALADRDAEEAMEEVLVAAEVNRLLRIADRELTPRERRVLDARYGLGGQDPRTLREVGEELGLTPQRVAQLEKGALDKLRAALGAG
jgi:RNA polymerase sigma factor (sigma-70 family)